MMLVEAVAWVTTALSYFWLRLGGNINVVALMINITIALAQLSPIL